MWQGSQEFDCTQIDWIAYHPYLSYKYPACIGILTKDVVMPRQIGQGIGPTEAESVLQALKSSAPWLRSRVHGTTETSFYNELA